jgi:hypothetical protein
MSSSGSGQSHRLVLLKGRLIASMASAFVMAITGIGWTGYHTAVGRIIISHVLSNALTSSGADQNILLMGLDSRLDQNGQPLPPEMYEALHAGDETSGGYNANVLIIVHISGRDGPGYRSVDSPRQRRGIAGLSRIGVQGQDQAGIWAGLSAVPGFPCCW